MVDNIKTLVAETAANPGTGPVLLDGPLTNRVSFVVGFGDGGRPWYTITDGQQSEWGLGTVTAGDPNTLSRDTVIGNTEGTTDKLNFTTNVTVYTGLPAEQMVYLASDGKIMAGAEQIAAGDISFTPAGGIEATDVQAAVQELESDTTTALADKLDLDGSAPMTGPLELPGDPTEANHAATKGYVDANAGAGAGDLAKHKVNHQGGDALGAYFTTTTGGAPGSGVRLSGAATFSTAQVAGVGRVMQFDGTAQTVFYTDETFDAAQGPVDIDLWYRASVDATDGTTQIVIRAYHLDETDAYMSVNDLVFSTTSVKVSDGWLRYRGRFEPDASSYPRFRIGVIVNNSANPGVSNDATVQVRRAAVWQPLNYGEGLLIDDAARAQAIADASHGRALLLGPNAGIVTISVGASGAQFTSIKDALDAITHWRFPHPGTGVQIDVAADIIEDTAPVQGNAVLTYPAIQITHPDGRRILIKGVTGSGQAASVATATTRFSQFSGDGVTKTFALTALRDSMKIRKSQDLTVFVDDVWKRPDGDTTNDYSYDALANSFGEITFASAPASGTNNGKVLYALELEVTVPTPGAFTVGRYAKLRGFSGSGADGSIFDGLWEVRDIVGSVVKLVLRVRHSWNLSVGTITPGTITPVNSVWRITSEDPSPPGNAWALMVLTGLECADLVIDQGGDYYDAVGVATWGHGAYFRMHNGGGICGFAKYNAWTYQGGHIKVDGASLCGAGDANAMSVSGGLITGIDARVMGGGNGLSIDQAEFIGSLAQFCGNANYGISGGEGARMTADSIKANNNGVTGVFGEQGARLFLKSGEAIRNKSYNVRATDPDTYIQLTSSDVLNGGHASYDVIAQTGGKINLIGTSGSPRLSPVANTPSGALGQIIFTTATP